MTKQKDDIKVIMTGSKKRKPRIPRTLLEGFCGAIGLILMLLYLNGISGQKPAEAAYVGPPDPVETRWIRGTEQRELLIHPITTEPAMAPDQETPPPATKVPEVNPEPTEIIPEPKSLSEYTEQDWAELDAGQLVSHPRREPDQLVTVKISRYDPDLGGINCAYPCDRTANGLYVPHWYEKGIACVPAWPFGTIVEVGGRRWQCIDRGGAIQEIRPGVFWIDQLTKNPQYGFGTELPASVWFPQ